jgi:hypothetical protein
MRGTTSGVGLLVAVLLGLCGCVTTGNHIKAPKLPEQYNSPPADDPRYTDPPKYPKDTMKRPLLRKDDGMGPGGPGMPGMPGGGASQGAPMSVGGAPGMGMGGR